MNDASGSLAFRLAFAVITGSLLLTEIALTRVFSGTIGYYFAFMSISVAMLGLGAGSLWITLRGPIRTHPHVRAAVASLGFGLALSAATWLYLRRYPALGTVDAQSQKMQVVLFGALFVPFLLGGVIVSAVFEAHKKKFATLYAVDLVGAGLGCVIAPILLGLVAAPKAMFVIAALAALAAPLFLLSVGRRRWAAVAAGGVVLVSVVAGFGLRHTDLFDLRVIRGATYKDVALDKWNDFSRVIVTRSPFFTWGLSETFPRRDDPQFDLMIEGVAGTQIQKLDRDIRDLTYFEQDIMALPHLLARRGSALVLGVGGGFDVLQALHFGKAPIVGVEVNPLVDEIVNEDFGAWSSRPYHMPGVTVHIENARTWVKRDRARYDVVTVTWVDSGAATGAGAFALSENYLYTVEAFQDYLARLSDDGVLGFMRARWTPPYDAIKGIGVAVEAMQAMGIAEPEKNIVVSGVKSPHFFDRVLCHVMIRHRPFTAEQIATIDEFRTRLHFLDFYTPGRGGTDAEIVRLITGKDRKAVYASFAYDMEPNHDDRPFYFFLRAMDGREGGREVKILEQSMRTIFVLIAVFLAAPLVALARRREVKLRGELLPPTIYFSLLGLGFMLIEMKLLQQASLVIGNPTLTLSLVLAGLLLSTGVGALVSPKLLGSDPRRRGMVIFAALLVVLVIAWLGAEGLADVLTAYPLVVRAAGLLLAIAPLGVLLGCALPIGMARLGDARGLLAWSWGMNGMFGVAGSAVSVYIAIHHGLRAAFGVGLACYVLAAAVYLLLLTLSVPVLTGWPTASRLLMGSRGDDAMAIFEHAKAGVLFVAVLSLLSCARAGKDDGGAGGGGITTGDLDGSTPITQRDGGVFARLPVPWQFKIGDIPSYKDPALYAIVKDKFGGPVGTDNKPAIVYPLEASLNPNNLLLITFQWKAGASTNKYFRIEATVDGARYDFYVPCAGAGASKGQCTYLMPQSEWLDIAGHSQASFVVTGTDGEGGPVTTSDPVTISFSSEPVLGGLYYWASSRGTIRRAAFGAFNGVDYVTPGDNALGLGSTPCVACHSVSRDGKTIAFSVTSAAHNTGAATGVNWPWGVFVSDTADPSRPYLKPLDATGIAVQSFGSYPALNADGTLLAVNGNNPATGSTPVYLDIRDARTGTSLHRQDMQTHGVFGTAYDMALFPEWSPDGKSIAVTLTAINWACFWDHKTCGGTIGVIPWDDATKKMGQAVPLVKTADGNAEFHFYPTWSPDGKWIAFVSQVGQYGEADAGTYQSSYDAQNGVLRMVPADLAGAPYVCPGPKCVDLINATQYTWQDALDRKGKGSTLPKFAPFALESGATFFLTYTSRRDYGFTSGDIRQLWMSQIETGKIAFDTGSPPADPSRVPFWVPYQSTGDKNVEPYWTEILSCTKDPTGGCQGCVGGEQCIVDQDNQCHCESYVK